MRLLVRLLMRLLLVRLLMRLMLVRLLLVRLLLVRLMLVRRLVRLAVGATGNSAHRGSRAAAAVGASAHVTRLPVPGKGPVGRGRHGASMRW